MNEKDLRHKLLKEIRDELLELKDSPLYSYRKENNYFPVIGQGSHFAKIMFIGEAPGRNEAESGRPFCGRAGKILDELCSTIGLERDDVYITNIVKDRPPQNRDPLPEEISFYSPFLDRQIKIIQPEIIATLGRFSMDYIMRKFDLDLEIKPISQMHGQIFSSPENKLIKKKIKIVPLYHPAVAIYNQKEKDTLIKDFQILKNFI